MRNNVFIKLRKLEPPFTPSILFDVGANRGQTVEEMRRTFPSARIHTFEPVASTFAMLQEAVADDPFVTAHRLAFGQSAGTVTMSAHPGGLGNHVVPPGTARSEVVPIMRGDDFCAEHEIDHIDFLKIDTEGFDLNVLAGFTGMLRDRIMEWVQVECGLSPENWRHIPLASFITFLHPFGYGFYGLFDQRTKMRNVPTKRGALSANAVFVRNDPVPQG